MIYLAQTDTTAGFLSKDLKALNALKNRPQNTPCLITTAKFCELKKLTRVPNTFKNLVRRAKKTTFIYPNSKAVRVVKEHEHSEFLSRFSWLYSTSANIHGQRFDENWARSVANIVVDEFFYENIPSRLLKLSRKKIRKMR